MDPHLVEKFIEVTGETEAIAHQYLALADGNVEAAISLMFEGSSRAPDVEIVDPDPPIRPPILPTQEILVPPDPVCSFPRLSNNVFDRFRDFAVETQRQEEEMTRRVSGVKQISQRKSKRLEDLFRPPCNILYMGTFIEAREHAKGLNRWLLVNIQNSQEFACQILNRDVWPNQQIQEIVKDHFVLWQVLSNASDGKRYIDFYNVLEYPYLAIIDPRTGECMRTYNHITVDTLISALNDMLSTHASPENAPQNTLNAKDWNNQSVGTTEKPTVESVTNEHTSSNNTFGRTTDGCVHTEDKNNLSTIRKPNVSPSTSSSGNMTKRRKMDEPDSEMQCKRVDSKDAKQNEAVPNANITKTGDGSTLRLCLRLPNGAKETISMYATDTIENFLDKMKDMGFAPSDHSYLIPFPKTNIGALPADVRLLDTILFPANTVFITKM
ncbi:hypothetical protein KM043_000910 [Ampulex compressa]|nr:hypothetical protein KM043_000910 [Ampulex compressa]